MAVADQQVNIRREAETATQIELLRNQRNSTPQPNLADWRQQDMAVADQQVNVRREAETATQVELLRHQRNSSQQQRLADWKQQDMAEVAQLASKAPVSWQKMTETDLVTQYQQHQGTTNHCASYSISTALNMLYGTNTTGQDVIDTFTNSDLILPSWVRYSWLLDGGAVLPSQQERIVNDLSSMILGQIDNLPTAETKTLTAQEMIEVIMNPNKVAVFTYNTTEGKISTRHAVVLAAYDLERGFGFLNSGADRDPLKPNELTWKSLEEMEAYIQDPIGLWNPNFVVISKQP